MANRRRSNIRPFILPPGFWEAPATRVALVANDFGELFRLVLAATGSTQEALGHRVEMTQSEVSAVLRGERTITTVKVVGDVVDGLEMPDRAWEALMLGAFGRMPRHDGGEEDAMDRREAIQAGIAAALTGGLAVSGALGERVAAAAAHKPDSTTADHLHALVRHLSDESTVRPMTTLLPQSRHLAGLAEGLLHRAPDRLLPDLGRVATEAAALHWWFLVSAGEEREAEVMKGKAVELASAWEVPAVVGVILTRTAGKAMSRGDIHGAVRLARAARRPHQRLTTNGQLMATWTECEALALVGDHKALAAAIGEATAAHAAVAPGDVKELLVPRMDENHLRLSGLTLGLIGDGPTDTGAFEDALSALPGERTSDHAYFTAALAVSCALAGDAAGAVAATDRAARLALDDGSTLPMGSTGLPVVARRHEAVRAVLADHGLAVPA